MNAFEHLAERQISAPRKARLRAAEKRAERKPADRKAAERKATKERQQLSAAWRRWQNEQREKLLAGPDGNQFRILIGFLNGMNLHDGAALIAMVEADWAHAGADMKFEALSLIDRAIIALRARNGLPAFDDPLSDEAPSVFQIIREVLA